MTPHKNKTPRAPESTTERQARLTKSRALMHRDSSAYGGSLYSTRNNRQRARPLTFKNTSMHLVLRSSQARGERSFRDPKNKIKIQQALDRFSKKHQIKIITWANVGNHLHFHLRLQNRSTYNAFIRALTSAIAMAVARVSRWNRTKQAAKSKTARFWDQRPFSRAVRGNRYFKTLNDYIWINDLEGRGSKRSLARFFVELYNAKVFDRRHQPLRI